MSMDRRAGIACTAPLVAVYCEAYWGKDCQQPSEQLGGEPHIRQAVPGSVTLPCLSLGTLLAGEECLRLCVSAAQRASCAWGGYTAENYKVGRPASSRGGIFADLSATHLLSSTSQCICSMSCLHGALHMRLRTCASICRLDAVLTDRQVADPRTPSPDPESSRLAMAPDSARAQRGRWGDESASDVSIGQPGMGDDRSAEPDGSARSRDVSVRRHEGSAADERQREGLRESRWAVLHNNAHAMHSALSMHHIPNPWLFCGLFHVSLQICKRVLQRQRSGSGQRPSLSWSTSMQPRLMRYHLLQQFLPLEILLWRTAYRSPEQGEHRHHKHKSHKSRSQKRAQKRDRVPSRSPDARAAGWSDEGAQDKQRSSPERKVCSLCLVPVDMLVHC